MTVVYISSSIRSRDYYTLEEEGEEEAAEFVHYTKLDQPETSRVLKELKSCKPQGFFFTALESMDSLEIFKSQEIDQFWLFKEIVHLKILISWNRSHSQVTKD